MMILKKVWKKIQTSLDKLKKYAILRTRWPLNGDDLKEKNIKNSEVKTSDVPWKIE